MFKGQAQVIVSSLVLVSTVSSFKAAQGFSNPNYFRGYKLFNFVEHWQVTLSHKFCKMVDHTK